MQHLLDAMKEARESANSSGQAFDLTDSYRTQMLSKRDMFAKQLDKNREEGVILRKIDYRRINVKVEFGAVVITDSQKLFIAVGIGKVVINKEIYYCISPNVPFYKAMEGMKKGEEFEFRGKKVKIRELF